MFCAVGGADRTVDGEQRVASEAEHEPGREVRRNDWLGRPALTSHDPRELNRPRRHAPGLGPSRSETPYASSIAGTAIAADQRKRVLDRPGAARCQLTDERQPDQRRPRSAGCGTAG